MPSRSGSSSLWILAFSGALVFQLSTPSHAKRTSPTPRSGQSSPLLTVSGVSAGAFAAVQHHVAYSSRVQGAGLVAGGPYWCANDDIAVATTACQHHPELIVMDDLYGATEYAYATGTIDDPSYIVNAGVYLLSGKLDTVVDTGVVKKAEEYYNHYIGAARRHQVVANYNLTAEHSFPTKDYGSACPYLGEPFINDCDFDAAGAILSHLYAVATGKSLTPPANNRSHASNIVKLATSSYLPALVPIPKAISLDDYAFAYVPTQCQAASREGCTLHVAYHGCLQTQKKIGMKFVEDSGYLPWAEANNIVILFPQAVESDIPFNPKGCFDWWGYTGTAYATKLGPQLRTVTNMLTYLEKRYT